MSLEKARDALADTEGALLVGEQTASLVVALTAIVDYLAELERRVAELERRSA